MAVPKKKKKTSLGNLLGPPGEPALTRRTPFEEVEASKSRDPAIQATLNTPLSRGDPSQGTFDFSQFKKPEPIGAFPLLAPTAPPRRRRRRSDDPFDFFGTLFTNPATGGLNPTNLLNETI